MVVRNKIILLLILAFGISGCQTLQQYFNPTPTLTLTPGPTLTPSLTYTPWPAFITLEPSPSFTPPPAATIAPSGTPFPTGSPTPVILGAVNFAPNINPLTGLQVANPDILKRRPVMVKVSNFPRTGRPHAGLSAADMVFEYYIGEYENRFMAVYYSQDSENIGPLRSGRLVDAPLTLDYGGILVYGNADPRVDEVLVNRLGTRAITFDDAPCPPICGKDTHTVEGVFVNSAATTQYANNQKIDDSQPNLWGMVFDYRLPTDSQNGNFLGVMFGPDNRGEWRYDPASQTYYRWIEDEKSPQDFTQTPLIDRNTGQQLAFENVIILYTRYTELLPTMFAMDIDENTNGQRAVFFRDGVSVEGSWRSNGPDKPLAFTNSWGARMPLKPGKSWIIMVGLSSDLTQTSPGHWELEYHTK